MWRDAATGVGAQLEGKEGGKMFCSARQEPGMGIALPFILKKLLEKKMKAWVGFICSPGG